MIDLLRCPYCWGDLTPEQLSGSLFEVDGYGTLACDCDIYPVLDGIPILDRRHNGQRLVALVRDGAFSMATSECLMVDVECGRVQQLFWRALRKFGMSNRLCERVQGVQIFRDALKIGMSSAGAYYQYLRCRFSDPTFVAGEWLLAQSAPTSGWILDVPAGAGHFSWALRQQHPAARIMIADSSFFFMMMAKRFIVRSANAVCLDGNMPLPFKTDQFDLAVSSDGWHYLDAQALFLQELLRVKCAEATLVMLHAHNRAVPNDTAGRPFSLEEIMRLLIHAQAGSALVLNERAVAARAWSPEPGDRPFNYIADTHSHAFDVWIGRVPHKLPANCRDYSGARGKWIVNPLYRRANRGAYVRHFVNRQYQEEFSDLISLLPEEVHVDTAGDEAKFDRELARRRIILFVPERY